MPEVAYFNNIGITVKLTICLTDPNTFEKKSI